MLFDGLVHWKVQDSTKNEQTLVVEFIGYMKPQAKLLLNVTKFQKHQLGALEIIHTLFWELSSLGSFCSMNLLESPGNFSITGQ